ncbi:hypothetical protein SNE40_009892 [Patella caerulea]|uniref:Large ribosomal subunit protein mL49 n=2 Tax=Patella caerulea TaxID=87958 RepID=A0AAN8PZ57_PATCE
MSIFRNILTKSTSQLKTFSRLSTQVRKCSNISESSLPDKGQDELIDFEVSTKEMKYVERLMPQLTVPEVPKHSSYPTPSGWVPPREEALSLPYQVRRTKNHMLPVYHEQTHQNRHCVHIRKVEGDIWALEAALKEHLQQLYPEKQLASQVHEVARSIRIKGHYIHDVADFLISKGF